MFSIVPAAVANIQYLFRMLFHAKMTYLLLFYEFFKTGLFAVGGGLATLPFIYDIAVRYPEWINMNDISNMIAVSESTPGPMGVNMATFTGFTTAGVFGACLLYTSDAADEL